MKNPTIKDVAELANVATSTVSLVVNNSSKVSQRTRKKVLDAIEKLKYMPNNYAASLRQTKKTSFGVIVPDMNNPYYIEVIKSLKSKCDRAGHMLQVCETNYDIEKEIQELNYLKSIRVDGYIFIGTINDSKIIQDIRDSKIVFIDKIDRTGKIPYIVIDNMKSIYEVTSYLISKGCKKVYYISETINTEILNERLSGYQKAMSENGLDFERKVVISNDLCLNKIDAGYNCIKNIIAYDNPDGIVTTSDLIAIGVLRGLYENNIKVPDEVSVIGYDNIDYARYTVPSLSTVNQPRAQMGEVAFSYLERDNVDIFNNTKTILKYDFIIRESTKK